MSRDSILHRVRARQGDATPLPDVPSPGSAAPDELLRRFTTVLEQVGGEWTRGAAGDDLEAIIRSHYPDAERVVSTIDEAPRSTVAISSETAPPDLVQIQLAIVRGRIGVAENAAIWIDDMQLPHRALPFVAEHCVLLLSTDDLVVDMHAAYAALAGRRYGWGVFVSGPSKTADIEQSLVIGAQGPRTVLVVIGR